MKGIASRVWVVSVPVSSFEKALSFYRDLLGFKIQLNGRFFNWMELGPDEPLCKIGVSEFREGVSGRRPGGPTGIVLDTDDIHEFHNRLSNKGVHFTGPPSKQVWGGWQADLADFDGNTMQVVQDPEHYTRKIPPIEQAAN